MTAFESNLATIQERLASAAQRSQRRVEDILFVAVTKTHPPETVAEAFDHQLFHVGENKVQEARAKQEVLGSRGVWHLIGHLQTNKAKLAAKVFDWVESVDSEELAQLLSRAAQEESRHLQVLLQVNVSGEGTKFGLRPSETAALAEKVNALPHLELRGLMTMAPFYEEVEKTRPVFAALRGLRDQVQMQTGLHLPDLSMGMSQDFEIAVEEGSTIVRLGTVLFGARQKPTTT
jgi:PLP dependent protein